MDSASAVVTCDNEMIACLFRAPHAIAQAVETCEQPSSARDILTHIVVSPVTPEHSDRFFGRASIRR
jgi:hypothetical protein